MNSLSRVPRQRRCTECKEMFMPKRLGLEVDKQCGFACAIEAALDVSIVSKPKKSKPIPKQKKKALKTAAKLKTELWPIFSLHQKLAHSADGEWCQCYTCDKPLQIGTTNCQGGHCLPKAVYKNLYFDERATRPQCYYCNINLGGMHYDFCERLKQEIGADEFEEMKRTGKDIVKRDRVWYLEKIEYYIAQNKLLKELKNS